MPMLNDLSRVEKGAEDVSPKSFLIHLFLVEMLGLGASGVERSVDLAMCQLIAHRPICLIHTTSP